MYDKLLDCSSTSVSFSSEHTIYSDASEGLLSSMDADTAAQEPVNLELQSTNKETDAAESCDGDPATHPDHQHVKMVHGNIYFDVPWSPQIYFTVRGAENFHIYLWIAKDLSWTTDNYNSSLFFGSSALAWCAVLVYHAFSSRDYREMYMLVGLMLWLAGNFVWMEVMSQIIAEHVSYVRYPFTLSFMLSWIGGGGPKR